MKNQLEPMKTALTGAGGFLGWHVRAALKENDHSVEQILVGSMFDLESACRALESSDRVIHIAGVNRDTDENIEFGNIQFATQLAEALLSVQNPPMFVVYANTVQAGNDTAYGESKSIAAEILTNASSRIGATFLNIKLPNLFGEHGKPFYNAVTSTFCKILVDGGTPIVKEDKELTLLHAQDAADLLIGNRAIEELDDLIQRQTVSELLNQLTEMHEAYNLAGIPDISTKFLRDLFNTYRSYKTGVNSPIELVAHTDARGSFTELVQAGGGTGQSSFSTTAPGIERGGHFHRRKVERFVVLSGSARISMRKIFTGEVLNFDVNGTEPVAIDMPTMWTHSITNTGDEILFTHFWTNDLFDPGNPDTIMEAV